MSGESARKLLSREGAWVTLTLALAAMLAVPVSAQGAVGRIDGPAMRMPAAPIAMPRWSQTVSSTSMPLPAGESVGKGAQAPSGNGQAASENLSPGDSSPAARNVSAFAASRPSPAQPVELILANKAAIRATECWLGNDGNLHYVTASGVKMTVPLQQFDMPATMAANRQKGVQLLIPTFLGQERAPKQP